MKISEISECSILSYTQNRKLRNLGKCSSTSNFDISCNLRSRNDKNELRQKLKGQDMLLEEKKKISEISEFSILPHTQNRKLGNLGKCSVTLNFDSIYNFFRICIFCKQSEALFFFSIKKFFSKCDQIRTTLRIWSHLQKKSLMGNFIFSAVPDKRDLYIITTQPMISSDKENLSYSLSCVQRPTVRPETIADI